jgi:trehalose-6-phosphatase
MDAVLSSLAADSKNEVWMVARLPVDLLESIYGHVKKLNLAGSNGRIFSEQNKALVELPDVSLLERKASQFIKGMSTL